MKVIIAAIAALGAISSFTGAAIADVSISIRFGSSPSHNTYRSYDSYRSSVYQSVYPVHYDQNSYDRYNHLHNNQHNRHVNSSVIVREVYPSSSYYGNSWGNSWNYSVAPNYVIPANHPYSTIRSTVYNPYNVDLGDRYIIQERVIRVR